jgi:endonuclease G
MLLPLLFLSPAPVIGGSNAPQGKWPDVAAILYRQDDGSDFQMCTGTLIAPTVVITAGHCAPTEDADIGTLDNVLLGTNSLARPQDGETVPVASFIEYPNSQSTVDITVIVLARAAVETPRPIATGWARLDIQNGAPVQFVGYGSIDRNGNDYIDDLQEAMSTITDYNCSQSSGCNSAARPDGELGAGGMGIDTCPGDSGGPMYLLTSYGNFLAGATSRGYDNSQFACSEGGIYGRPDKIVDWIEEQTGVKVARGPEPAADPIMAVHGDAGETVITANDPKSDNHTYAITTPPAHGTAKVRADGRVRVCTDPAAAAGSDSVVVTVTDADHSNRAVSMTIPIEIADGSAPASCDIDAFSIGDDGGGCCEAGGGGAGAIPLALGVLALVIRSRRGRDLAQV